MKLKSIIKNTFAFALATAISVNGTATIFAEEKTEGESSKSFMHQRISQEEQSAIYQSVLNNMVESGSLTQAQADTIASLVSKRGEGNKNHFSDLVSAGTITQEQADAISAAMKDARDSGQSLNDIAADLVSAGTITQEQADAINSAVPFMGTRGDMPKRSENGGTSEIKRSFEGKITKEQAGETNDSDRSFIKAKRAKGEMFNSSETNAVSEHKSPFADLVSAGTITQVQADTINDAIKGARESKQSLSDIVTSLVSEGTIMQEQANAINSAMPFTKARGEISKMPERKSFFTDLVSAGTITQDQADAVLNAVKEAFEAADTNLK